MSFLFTILHPIFYRGIPFMDCKVGFVSEPYCGDIMSNLMNAHATNNQNDSNQKRNHSFSSPLCWITVLGVSSSARSRASFMDESFDIPSFCLHVFPTLSTGILHSFAIDILYCLALS